MPVVLLHYNQALEPKQCQKQIAYLEAKAVAEGISIAAAARRAIARDAYLQKEMRNSASLFIKTKDGLYELTL